MATDRALRFAKASISLYRHEQTFSISVDREEELDPMTEAFVSLGCAVTKRDAIHLVLTVSCGGGQGANFRSPFTVEEYRDLSERERSDMRWRMPNLGDNLLLASHMRSVARESVERAKETRQASKDAAIRFAQDQARRKQDADRRGPW